MYKPALIILIVNLCLLLTQAYTVDADDWYESKPDYFTVYLSDGGVLFKIGRKIYVGDEYISENNKKYRIIKVDPSNKTATAEFIEDIELSDISGISFDSHIPTSAQQKNKTIGIYCTHSDESYLPSDGAASINANGGVLDVAKTLAEEFEKAGIKAAVDTTPHDPHDAGAYRRSRQTAVKIIKEHSPIALFDIHRDAVPKEEYITKLEGEEITKIRIVVGRSNQNRQANESFAYRIKAVADKQYPGLIKDIFIGKGNYNQELLPHSLLLEFGTYNHMKQRALKATSFFAEVVNTVLFGGTILNQNTQQEEKVPQFTKKNTGAAKGILVLIFVLIVGGGAFFYLSSGEEEAWAKIQILKNFILAVKESIVSLFRK